MRLIDHPRLKDVEELEEVVWETSGNIKDKVEAVIQRSRRVMEVFKSVTKLRT